MIIFVPSRGRMTEKEQYTRRYFCLDEVDEKICPVYYIVHPSEKSYWKRQKVKYFCADTDGIAQTRQWIREEFAREDVCHFVIDDDLRLCRKWHPNESPGRTVREYEHIEDLMFWVLRKFRQGYSFGTVAYRMNNNSTLVKELRNKRPASNMFYRADLLDAIDHDFSPFRLKQDFQVALELLTKGFPNICNFEFSVNIIGSNTPGGCSRYRTRKLMKKSSEVLFEMYPGLVRLRKKSPKSDNHFRGLGKEVVDVTIQWEKAYQEGREWLHTKAGRKWLKKVQRRIDYPVLSAIELDRGIKSLKIKF